MFKNNFYNRTKIRIKEFLIKFYIQIKNLSNIVKNKLILFCRFLSSKFEDIFNENKFSSLFSFILAIISAISISTNSGFNLVKQVGYTIKDKNIIFQYNKEKFVVEYNDKKADIVLMGDDVSIQSAKNNKDLRVLANLNNLTTGIHAVSLNVENLNSNINAYPVPSTIEVNILNREYKNFQVRNEVINNSFLENVVIQNISLTNDNITLSGSNKDLKKVSFVKALIDGKIIKESIKDKTDILYEGVAPVVAYDEQGNKLDNILSTVEGIPYKVQIKPVAKKVVSNLKIKTKGSIPHGKAIKNIDFKNAVITVYGKQEELDKLNSLNIIYDLNCAGEKGNIEGIIENPENVVLSNFAPKKIQSIIEYGPEEVSVATLQTVNLLNANNDLYNYEIDNKSNSITSNIYATSENLLKLSDVIQKNEIKLFIDVLNLHPGEHEVPINISSPFYYRCTLSQKTIKLKITKK